MLRNKAKWMWGLLVLGMLTGLAVGARAADEGDQQESKKTVKKQVRVVVRAGAAKNWLGIHLVPVDAPLKSQLQLEDRLIVEQVVPDSPAARAGVAQYDILLKFNDREITKLADLTAALDANQDAEAKLLVLRGGKQKTLKVTPTARPAQDPLGYQLEVDSEELQLPDLELFLRKLTTPEAKETGRVFRFHVVGPGFVDFDEARREGEKPPADLSITVHKRADEPAKITVELGDEKWEVTDETLDKLPDAVRPHVERMLGRGKMRQLSLPDGERLFRLKSLQVTPDGAGVEVQSEAGGAAAAGAEGGRAAGRARVIIDRRRDASGDDAINELRRELKELRREIERLKDRDPRDEPPGDDADES